MYAMAKSAREKLKAKARSLAAPGTLKKDQDTTQADWTPAEPLDADVKTGARPVGKARLYNKGGKVSGSAVKARADRKARTGRNPQTGETVNIKATRVPKFRAGAEFKSVVSGAKKAAPAKKAAAKKAPAKKAAAKKK